LVDRVIFKLLNRKEIQESDFDMKVNACLLKEKGKKKFVQAFEERLEETIKHRSLGRNVSYKQLM
jgi:CRISPR-associated protein Cas1